MTDATLDVPTNALNGHQPLDSPATPVSDSIDVNDFQEQESDARSEPLPIHFDKFHTASGLDPSMSCFIQFHSDVSL